MRNGLSSSRGATRGTIGGTPLGRVVIGGFATVAIWIGPFRCADCVAKSSSGSRPPNRKNFWTYAFAANFWIPFTYLSRHSIEQKWSNSLPFRRGIAIVSARCVPQTGSRTNFRPTDSCGTNTSGCVRGPSSAMPPTSRLRSRNIQETTTTQNK